MRRIPDLPAPFTFFSDILKHPDVEADVRSAELTVEMLNRSAGPLSPNELSTIVDMTLVPIRGVHEGRNIGTAYMGTLAKIGVTVAGTIGRPLYGEMPRDPLTPPQVKDELAIIARRLEPSDASQVLHALFSRQDELEPAAYEHRLARRLKDQARPQRLFGNALRDKALQAAETAQGNAHQFLASALSDRKDMLPLIDQIFGVSTKTEE